MASPEQVWVALLRAVNVGGKNVIKMAELRGLCEALGWRDVSTYLQSGNVVFRAGETDEQAVRTRLEDGIKQQFGINTEVIVRSAAELDDVVHHNPFVGRDELKPNWLTVMFFNEAPGDALEGFRSDYAGREQLAARGRDLYIYYTEGIGRSKLPRAMAPLKLAGTVRNWSTIVKLRDAAA